MEGIANPYMHINMMNKQGYGINIIIFIIIIIIRNNNGQKTFFIRPLIVVINNGLSDCVQFLYN